MLQKIKNKIYFAKIARLRKKAYAGNEKAKKEYRKYIMMLCRV